MLRFMGSLGCTLMSKTFCTKAVVLHPAAYYHHPMSTLLRYSGQRQSIKAQQLGLEPGHNYFLKLFSCHATCTQDLSPRGGPPHSLSCHPGLPLPCSGPTLCQLSVPLLSPCPLLQG